MNSEGGGFRKYPPRNIPEHKTGRYGMGREGGGKEGGDRGVRGDAGGKTFESLQSRPPESLHKPPEGSPKT